MQNAINQHIEFRKKRDGRERPFIKGTRVEVAYIVTDSEIHNMEPEEIAEGYPHVPLAAIYAALAFYHDNREDLRRMMREDDAIARVQQGENAAVDQRSHERTNPLSP
jgi:uncharacterized protein (DUF433 family)